MSSGTEAENAGTELGEVRAELARSRQAAEEFRARVNLELRTPLSTMLGFAELLEAQVSGLREQENARAILESGRRLLEVIDQEFGGAKLAAEEPVIPSRPEPVRILYIEDNEPNFRLVEGILKRRPEVKMLHADCGEAGVELALAELPRLILLDLNLPDIHGSEVLRRLREAPATAEIPVVVISADATATQIERLLAAGAQDYLTKPFRIQPFLAVIDGILARG